MNMQPRGLPIVVTGGAGFIGSHACKQLSAHGYRPVAYDNLSTGHAKAVRWGEFVEGDVLETAKLTGVLAAKKPSAVIHFAASAYVGESVSDPAKYYRNNVSGMLSLLQACCAAGVDKVIFSSSCATYGVPESLPISEASAQRPINPYGRTKLICENMLADFAAAYGLRYVALRYFNACGADPEGEIGEWHEPETHLIPRALMAAGGAIGALDIFGDDYPTDDGTCVRDYVHVTDLARAHVLAAQYLIAGGDNLCVNLGSEQGYSILEVLDSIKRVTGRTVPVSLKPRRPGDPPTLVADASLARSKLGFTPNHSDMDTIVRTASQAFGLTLAS